VPTFEEDLKSPLEYAKHKESSFGIFSWNSISPLEYSTRILGSPKAYSLSLLSLDFKKLRKMNYSLPSLIVRVINFPLSPWHVLLGNKCLTFLGTKFNTPSY
jgi:hypothetical protein